MDKAYDRQPTLRSRELRTNATPAERALWQQIRNRQILDIRFNRQVPIGPFICDFAARQAKLIIELDGGQHAVRTAADERRTEFLTLQGYRVLRFWNNDVLEQMDGVLAVIAEALKKRPSPTPSRAAGGEN
ncbi:MAG: endonuclease domain-containing protein [Pseudomonadota bacterium]|nr:endonuclease domain-containing protein [Pseudomonadota bacterium]